MTEQQAQTELCWQALGAWTGGSVLSVAAAQMPNGGSRILAAARAGLFRWDTGVDTIGGGWQPARQGLTDPSLLAVTFAGAAVDGWPTAFAASATGRLFRSDDGGLVWREVTAWAGLGVATVLAASPAFHEDGMLFAGTGEGFFRTLDGGGYWESCSFGLLDAEALCLVCAPDFAASQLLWAGTASGGLYRSRNQARAWRESGVGLPDAAVQALAVSPTFADDRTLYAGLEGHGVYRSRDGGESWAPCGPELAAHSINTLICAGSAAHLVAGADAGLFWSDDGGDHWQAAEEAAFAVLALAYAGGETVIAGSFQSGVMLSTDGGRRWASAPPLVAHAPPVIAATSAQLAALDIDGALALSHDGGQSWQELPAPEDEPVTAMALQPAGDNALLWAAASDGLYRWDGMAGQWHREWETPNGLVALEASGDLLAGVDAEARLWLRDAPGSDWRALAGPWEGQAVLRVLVDNGSAVQPSGPALTVLTAHPTEQGHYAMTVWQYSDGWRELAALAADIPAALALWPQGRDLFLAFQHRVVRFLTDPASGEPAAAQYFFAEGEQVTALAHGTAGLWAATTAALYRGDATGAQWTPVGALPDGAPVVALIEEAGRLTAVTLGGGCWRAGVTDE